MKVKDLFFSQKFRVVIFVLCGLAIIIGAFKVGEFVGARKAAFSYRWGENYGKNFNGMRPEFPPDFRQGFPQEGFLSSHGAFGEIAKIENGFITITSPDDVEKIIVVSEKTQIRRFRAPIGVTDLQVGDAIAVIGSPNEKGQIDAEVIRILPPPSDKQKIATSTQR